MANSGLVVKEVTIRTIRGDKMKILYFAHIKAKVNRGQDDFEFTEPITAKALKEHLGRTYPNINDESYQIAVNEEFVKDEAIIYNQDTVALIPPVSGG